MPKKNRPDGCLRCNRRLKNPRPSGMGPVCEKKAAAAQSGLGGQATEAAGQVPLFQEGGQS